MSEQAHLRLTGFSSISKLEDIFASLMVDIAYIREVGDSYASVFPDDSKSIDLNKAEDREWLARVVRETLLIAGEEHVSISFVAAEP